VKTQKTQKTILAIIGGAVALGFIGAPLIGVINSIATPVASPEANTANDGGGLKRKADGYAIVLKREPDNVTALTGLAEIRRQQGNYAEAIRLYTQLEETTEDGQTRVQASMTIAELYQKAGQLPQALAKYDFLLALDPKNIPAQLGKAMALKGAGRLPEANALYLNLLTTAPAELKKQITEIYSKAPTGKVVPTAPPVKK
jgi:tetratricopeptide (TPR) repeat protein